MKRTRLIIIAIILLLFSIGIIGGRFSFHGKPAGIYLLKDTDGHLFELKDQLQLADYERLIARVEFEALYERWRSRDKAADGTPYLKYSWNREDGSGYFINFFPDGSKFLVCLGRFRDADNKPVHGIFTGGGLPHTHYEDTALKTPETGVAYYDESGWHHLWGSTPETLSSAAARPVRPGSWEFIGSEILFSSQYQLALKSSHLIRLDQQPLRVDRYFNYHAGERFFSLITRFTNPGSKPLTYRYCYNDLRSSPSGSADDTKLMERIDISSNFTIGLSGYQYTPNSGNMANFISWEGGAFPDNGYLTGKPVIKLSAEGKSPLKDGRSRKAMLQWQERTLPPGQSEIIFLTIGMADHDRQTNVPRRPATAIDPAELRFLLGR